MPKNNLPACPYADYTVRSVRMGGGVDYFIGRTDEVVPLVLLRVVADGARTTYWLHTGGGEQTLLGSETAQPLDGTLALLGYALTVAARMDNGLPPFPPVKPLDVDADLQRMKRIGREFAQEQAEWEAAQATR